MRNTGLLVLAAILAAPSAAAQDATKPEAPKRPEPATESLHGLRVEVLAPPGGPESARSLLVFLHGGTGNGKEVVAKLAPLVDRGFVVAGPWAKSGFWAAPELEAVKGVVRDLVDRYTVPRERRHLGGFWTGAGDLGSIAFDESLGLRTCCWMDAAWPGGSVPKWAKESFHGIFLWGAKEGPSRVDRYRRGAASLAEKVRLSVARGEEPEPGLGRGRSEDPLLPEKLLPFWGYFMECMEGRYEHGRDLSFEWEADLDAARMTMVLEKTGGFVYVWSKDADAAEKERTKVLQNEVFFDPLVRHFGEQLVPVRLEKAEAKALLEQAKVAATPAVVVFKKGGKEISRALSGEVTAKALAPVLRASAPDPEMPR